MRAAAVAAAVVAGLLGVMYVRFSGDSQPSPQATATPARVVEGVKPSDPGVQGATPYDGPWPAVFGDTTMKSLVLGGRVSFPEETAVIAAMPCVSCGGGLAITRLYRIEASETRIESVLDFNGGFVDGSQYRSAPHLMGFAASSDGSDLAVAVCTVGPCTLSGDQKDEGNTPTVFRSSDGGMTWSNVATLKRGDTMYGLTTIFGQRDILVGNWAAINPESRQSQPPVESYRLLLSGEPVVPPKAGARPVIITDGPLLWDGGQGDLMTATGEPVADLERSQSVPSIVGIGGSAAGQVLSWAWDQGSPRVKTRFFVGRFGPDGHRTAGFDANYFSWLAGWLDEDRLIGSSAAGVLPSLLPLVVFDLRRGTIDPIEDSALHAPQGLTYSPEMQLGPFGLGSSRALAVQRGPFARVVNTEGTCLNIRAEPYTNGRVLDCTAEGVLLRDLAQVAQTDATFARVVTPAGVEGWASTQYLER